MGNKLSFLLFAAVMAFCSCGKDYPKLVKQQVEKYKSEGKIILSQSNDSTGKEHYIVYADVQAQTIGVDTLGEKVDTIKLADIVEKRIDIPGIQLPEKFHVISNDPNFTGKANLRINKDGSFSSDTDWDVTVYKDKYLVLETKPDYDLGCSKKWSILWFGKPENTFTYFGSADKEVVLDQTNGEIKITIKSSEDFYPGGEKQWVDMTYNVTFDCNGNVKQQDDYVDYNGTSVPISAYGNADALKPYIDAIETSIVIGNAQMGIY